MRTLLAAVQRGEVEPDEALEQLARPDFVETEHGRIDVHRELRQGLPETIFGAGKTAEQIAGIVNTLRRAGQSALATRVPEDVAGAVLEAVPGGEWLPEARLLWYGPAEVEPNSDGVIAVVCAGTSDLPVASEAAEVARRFGNKVELLVDVGVAGIHRLLASVDVLRSARVVIVVAGMEGALPSVVGGLVQAPVIAVPTSVGYGAAFERRRRAAGDAQQLFVERRRGEHRQRVRCGRGRDADQPRRESRRRELSMAARRARRRDATRGRVLHLDTFSGIAGNMFLGALLDAGLPRRELTEGLAGLGVEHRLRVSKVKRGALAARYVAVSAPKPKGHGHGHRHWSHIRKLLDAAKLAPAVRDRAQATFEALARAEGRVHDIPPERVHFHEVGAVDAIVDITGAAIAIEALGIQRITAAPPALGHGQAEMAHGVLPLPAPATLELLRGIPTVPAHVAWETVTPTGAALLATQVDEIRTLPAMTIEATGYGAATAMRRGFRSRFAIGCATSWALRRRRLPRHPTRRASGPEPREREYRFPSSRRARRRPSAGRRPGSSPRSAATR